MKLLYEKSLLSLAPTFISGLHMFPENQALAIALRWLKAEIRVVLFTTT